jgi:hypothetical protein
MALAMRISAVVVALIIAIVPVSAIWCETACVRANPATDDGTSPHSHHDHHAANTNNPMHMSLVAAAARCLDHGGELRAIVQSTFRPPSPQIVVVNICPVPAPDTFDPLPRVATPQQSDLPPGPGTFVLRI